MQPSTGIARFLGAILSLALLIATPAPALAAGEYPELLELFREWQAFERPADARRRARLHSRDLVAHAGRTARVPVAPRGNRSVRDGPADQQIDYALVRAQMNGHDFDLRVLQPWARDPAFYKSLWTEQSDTPAHEGPTHHAVIEFWTYCVPAVASPTSTKLAARAAHRFLRCSRRLGSISSTTPAISGSPASGRCRSRPRIWRRSTRPRPGPRPELRARSRPPGGDRGVRRLARAAGAVEDRPVGRRQGRTTPGACGTCTSCR